MRILLALALLLCAPAAWSQTAGADPTGLLGLDPAQAIGLLGAPERVYPLRGPAPEQDDVVFQYTGGMSLFFFQDRVWQVRLAKPYADPVMGFSLGASPDRALSVMGVPLRSDGAAWEWALPGSSYPIRLRALAGTDGLIAELYVYRGDF